MRIGKLHIGLADAKPRRRLTRKEAAKEIGASGVTVTSGILSNVGEHVPDLKPGTKYATYDKMRRSDGQVFAALSAIKMPILSAQWTIEVEVDGRKPDLEPKTVDGQEAPLDADAKLAQQVIADLEENLYKRINWREFLRQALTFLDFGYSLFESVYAVEDGKIWLAKLGMRLPSTIRKWYVDENDNWEGVQQWAHKGGSYRNFEIPREKLVLFNLGQEGNNFEGRSLLRAAYKHWYVKDELENIGAIAADRHGVGIPIAEILEELASQSAIPSDLQGDLETLLANLRSGEKSYMVLPPGVKVSILDQASGSLDVMPQIQYHAEEIAKSMLAEFINLGTTKTGARAVAETQVEMFLEAVQGMADEFAETVNADIVAPLVEWNHGPRVRATLEPSNIKRANIEMVSRAFALLAKGGFLTADPELENYLREIMDAPAKAQEPEEEGAPKEVPPEAQPELEGAPEGGEEAAEAREGGHVHGAEKRSSPFWREPTPAEQRVGLREIDGRLDDAGDRMVARTEQIRDRQIGELMSAIKERIAQRDITGLYQIEVPYQAELAQAMIPVLRDMYDAGRSDVAKEVTEGAQMRDAARTPAEAATLWEDKADIAALQYSQAMLDMSLRRSLDKYTQKGPAIQPDEWAEIERQADDLSDDMLRKQTGVMSAEFYGMGRRYEADLRKEDITRAIYSPIMDQNVCEVCAYDDQREVQVGSPEYDALAQPRPDCVGMQFLNFCRCIWIYETERYLGPVEGP